MLNIFYSDQDIEVIQDERYHHPHSAIRQRMTILALHSSGVVAEHIPPLANCSKKTVLKVLRLYRTRGLEGIYDYNKHTHSSALEPYTELIVKEFTAHPPQTINEACHRIEQLTGVKRCLTVVRDFLKKHGCRYLKSCGVPAKADVEAQQTFHDECLQHVITAAKAGQCHLYFMDATHLVMGAF
ncbi:MAG: winged helix-turn-helix domain-containing protein, partial [Planctomycetaceae bacterium]|nr:winged helix-turn-helix domain-containing protein [Planctomycetaceae bacterium]